MREKSRESQERRNEREKGAKKEIGRDEDEARFLPFHGVPFVIF